MEWSHEQIAHWRALQKEYLADTTAVAHQQEIDQQRQRVQQEMVVLLHSFLDGTITMKAFS